MTQVIHFGTTKSILHVFDGFHSNLVRSNLKKKIVSQKMMMSLQITLQNEDNMKAYYYEMNQATWAFFFNLFGCSFFRSFY
jgi:hypothetical protein